MPSFDVSLTAAGVGLIGSIIGAGAAIGAQMVTQKSIADRETRERDRREDRIRALFATRTEALLEIVQVAAAGYIWDADQVLSALAPLEALSADISLSLALRPEELYALAEALAAIRENIRTAAQRYEHHQKQSAPLTGDKLADRDEQLRRSLRVTYTIGFNALNALMRALGAKPVPAFDDSPGMSQ